MRRVKQGFQVVLTFFILLVFGSAGLAAEQKIRLKVPGIT